MADWILGYQKSVEDGGPGLSGEDWQRFESEVPEHPPEQLKALYAAFDGGTLNGGVKLYPFERVVEARNTSEDQSWVFGDKGTQRLLAARKATLASHPGLMIRPGWFETTHADELVFAVHDSRQGTVRVYPSLEQLLSVMVPPAQLEVFGDQTYARAMAAVESAISDVAEKVRAERKNIAKKLTGKAKAAGPAKSATPAKKSAPAKKPATAKTSAARKSSKPAGAKKSAARNSAKKPAAKKKAVAQKRTQKKTVRGKKGK